MLGVEGVCLMHKDTSIEHFGHDAFKGHADAARDGTRPPETRGYMREGNLLGNTEADNIPASLAEWPDPRTHPASTSTTTPTPTISPIQREFIDHLKDTDPRFHEMSDQEIIAWNNSFVDFAFGEI